MSLHDEVQWAVLLKYGKREHLEEFRDGLLYMNSEDYFSRLEGDTVRADHFEGTDEIHQPSAIKELRIENNIDGRIVVIVPKDLAGPIKIRFGKRPLSNIFCMFAVTAPKDSPFVDEQNYAFGDSFIVILNTQEFIDRACAAAHAGGFNFSSGLITYYDEKVYSGKTGLFAKPSTFAYQQEFRLAVDPGSSQPVRLRISSLTDITSPIHSLSDINQFVDFGLEGANQRGLFETATTSCG